VQTRTPRAKALASVVENRDEIESTSARWAPTEDVTQYARAGSARLGRGAMSEPITSERPAVAAAVIIEDGRVLLVRRRVREGRLSWQFPCGEVEAGESGAEAAVRETEEETGLRVRATGSLGERVHPDTGRTMIYTACDVVSGTAYVADKEELAEVAWCDRATLTAHVPYPFFGPVQEYLDAKVR
jgi:8-oxo-dGTP diphosphatase